MNKYEQAILHLELIATNMTGTMIEDDVKSDYWCEVLKSIDLAQEVLKKEIIKEPKEYDQNGKIYCLCPNCITIVGVIREKDNVVEYLNNYCSYCGQKVRITSLEELDEKLGVDNDN